MTSRPTVQLFISVHVTCLRTFTTLLSSYLCSLSVTQCNNIPEESTSLIWFTVSLLILWKLDFVQTCQSVVSSRKRNICLLLQQTFSTDAAIH